MKRVIALGLMLIGSCTLQPTYAHDCGTFNDDTTIGEIKSCMTPQVVDSGNCLADTADTLKACLTSGTTVEITSDIEFSGCPTILDLNNKNSVTIEGGGHTVLRTGGHRSCSMVEAFNVFDVAFNNVILDDDARVAPCVVGDKCPRTIHLKDSSNVSFDNTHIANGKSYVVYTDGVDGFTFNDSSLRNSGVLGMYIGHDSRQSKDVSITSSVFEDNSTNALALLGVDGATIRNNTFKRNHLIGQWPVAAQYGVGMTGGGQFYIAKATNVVVENNTFSDGACPDCLGGVHGIELSEPLKSDSVSNVRITGNTITNHTGTGIYLNGGSSVSGLIVADNDVSGSGQVDYSSAIAPTAVIPPVTTPEPDNGVCTATGSDLRQAIDAYGLNCPTIPRSDCDPVSGGWICSSAPMGNAPSSGADSSGSGNGSGAQTGSDVSEGSTGVLRVLADSVPLGTGWLDRGEYLEWIGSTERYLLSQRIDEANMSYTFDVPVAGTYRFNMRSRSETIFNAAEPGNDFWLKLPDQEWFKVWFNRDGEWHEDAIGEKDGVHSRELLDLNLQAGPVTIIVSGRSRGTSVEWYELEPQGFTVSVNSDSQSDLLSLHWDYSYDQDDAQAAIAARMIMDKFSDRSFVAVHGTKSYKNHGYIPGSLEHTRSLFPDAIDALLSSAANSLADIWEPTLRNGHKVLVQEGGTSDFTSEVIRVLQSRGVSNLKNIVVAQHSAGVGAFNEDMANPENLALVKSTTTYQPVPNGNIGGNGSADFQEPESSSVCQTYMAAMLSSKYASQWQWAFPLIETSRKCDQSDAVELLHLLGDTSTKTYSDFTATYL